MGEGAVPSVALRRNKKSLPPPPEKYVGLKIEIEGFSRGILVIKVLLRIEPPTRSVA